MVQIIVKSKKSRVISHLKSIYFTKKVGLFDEYTENQLSKMRDSDWFGSQLLLDSEIQLRPILKGIILVSNFV
jgi:hypothetical protein